MSDKSKLRELAFNIEYDYRIEDEEAKQWLKTLAEAIADEVERVDSEAAQYKRNQQEIRRNEFKAISDRLDQSEHDLLELANHTKLPTPGE